MVRDFKKMASAKGVGNALASEMFCHNTSLLSKTLKTSSLYI